MDRIQFNVKIRRLLHTSSEQDLQQWVVFAEECTDHKQFINFTEVPREEAVAAWLDALYASFYFVKRDFGLETAQKMLHLSADRLCLYPFEMREAAKAIQAGADTNRIFQLMRDGLLVDDARFPTMEDVQQDHKEKREQER